MITRELKTLSNINYRDTLVHILRQAPQGMDLDDMRRRLRIIETIENSNGTLELPDDDHQYVLRLVRGWKWPVAHSEIIQFVSDLEG